jgi:MFS family permease
VSLLRTPVTWATYGLNAAWASVIYLVGPISPIIADDLGVPRSVAGLVGTALAVGVMSVVVLGPAAVRRVGRDGAMRGGLAGVAILLAGIGLVPALLDGSVAFAVVLGLFLASAAFGGIALSAATARLSQSHPGHSATVITEANAAAAWVGLFSPLVLGVALGAGFGWWVGVAACLAAVVVALVGLLVADRMESTALARSGVAAVPVPAADPAGPDADSAAQVAADVSEQEMAPLPAAGRGRLPRMFWVAMGALSAAVATEFTVNFWGSTLIGDNTGAPTATATGAMFASVLGVALGRTIGPWVIARIGTHGSLMVGFAVALAGFALLWVASILPLAVAGLLLTGFGLAALFPLLLDRGIVLSQGRPDLAMSRASLVLGAAVGAAPLLLGWLGNYMPVRIAMLLVPAMILVGLVGVVRSRPPAEAVA